MRTRPPRESAVLRIAGPALVLLIGDGAGALARRVFERDEVLAPAADPVPRLDAGLLVAVPLEHPDPDAVRRLLAAAQGVDRPVDAVVLGAVDAALPARRLRRIVTADAADARIERVPGDFDRTDRTGPFDVIGDVHGCLQELLLLLARLGYDVRLDERGRPDGAAHPDGRMLVLAGDLVDRGPDVVGVLRLAMGMLASGDALAVLGNHDDKLLRALQGRRVEIGGGLDVSLAQLEHEPPAFRQAVAATLEGFPAHLLLDGGRLVVAHAGLAERYHGRESARVRALCLFGPTTGETDESGLPVRLPWADDYRGSATVVHGHTPTAGREWRNGTICIDGGCVFGGALVALRYPERVLVEVPAVARHSEPARPFLPAG